MDRPHNPAKGASAPIESVPDEAVRKWLLRCRDIAEGPLDGIENASVELAEFAAGDRRMMERARRFLLAQQAEHPGDGTTKQMLSLWRRAFEKGSWDWDD